MINSEDIDIISLCMLIIVILLLVDTQKNSNFNRIGYVQDYHNFSNFQLCTNCACTQYFFTDYSKS